MLKLILFTIYICIGFLIGIIAVKKAQISASIYLSIQLFWIIWAVTLLFLLIEEVITYWLYKWSKKEYLIEFKNINGIYESVEMNLNSRMSKNQLARYLEEGDNAVNLYLKQLDITLEEGERLEIEYQVYDKKVMPGVRVEQKHPKRRKFPRKKLVF